MKPITNIDNKIHEEQKVCHICKKEFCYDKKKKLNFFKKLGIIVIIQENLEELLITFAITFEI